MKLSDIIIDKHLFITIIVLVVFPVILIISDIMSQPIALFIRDYFKDPFLTAYVIEFLQNLVIYIQYIVFVAMIILYPSYSLIFSKDKYFGKRNSRSAVIEYELVRKIIFILFPFFILAIIFIIGQHTAGSDSLERLGIPAKHILFKTIMGVVFFIVGSALLRLVLVNMNKNFKFNLARVFFRLISQEKNEVDRMVYLVKGLTFYNKYIRERLGLQINNPKIIYAKIISDPKIDKNYFVKELSLAFEDSNKLKVIHCIADLKIVTDPDNILAKEPTRKKLEILSGEVGILVSIIAAILGLITTVFSS